MITGLPLDERCLTGNCGKIDPVTQRCTVYQFPVKKWSLGCPLAKKELTPEEEQKLNPLKASKRAARKKK